MNSAIELYSAQGEVFLGSQSSATVTIVDDDQASINPNVYDFNGDGKTGILWRNKVDGLNYAVFLNGMTPTGTSAVAMVSDLGECGHRRLQ